MTSKIIVNTIEADTGISSVTFASNINLQNDSSILVSSSGVTLGTGSTIAAPSANEIALSTNSAERLRVTSAGLVGIGTASADRQLHVLSSNGTVAHFESTNANTYSQISFQGNGAATTPYVGAIGAHFQITTGDTERLRITSAGNLGIGDASPTKPLTVGTTTPVILLDDQSSRTLEIRGPSTTHSATVLTTSTHDLLLGTNNAERLRIDSSGRTLISTQTARTNFNDSTIETRLQIEAAGDNDSAALSIISNAGTTNSDKRSGLLVLGRTRGTSNGSNTVVVQDDQVGMIEFKGMDGTSFTTAATIKAQVDGSVGTDDMPGRLIFSTTPDNAAIPQERLRISSDGNISIGGHSSNYANSLLEVRGTNAGGDVAIRVTNNSTTAGTQAGIIFTTTTADYTTAGIAFERGGTADALRFYVGQSAGGGGFTNATERLRITSDGNMGLGVTPVYSGVFGGSQRVLHIGGTAAPGLRIQSSTSNQGDFIIQAGNSGGATYLSNLSNNAHTAFFNTSGGSTTERMRLASNGEHMVYSNGTVSALRTAAASSGSSEILYCSRNSSSVTVGTGVYAIYSNGSASSLSDRTQKKNIETTRDGYLEDLNRLRVVKYNWNDQEDGTPKELGLIAQEVEEVFPGLISNMRSDVGIGTTASTKGVKTSVLPYMLLKALQEANAEIVALKARVNTLEGS